MARKLKTPIKAIREHCIDCSGGSFKEVKECVIHKCPLYPYRMGRRPDEATIDTMKEFYSQNPEPAKGFSARKGIPFKPSLVDISPSLIKPPSDKILSSACCIIKDSD